MKNVRFLADRPFAKASVALAAAAILVGGATWRGLAADAGASAPAAVAAPAAAAAQTPAPGRAFVGGRDSYADIVKTVTPAVVTIRTEGRARVRPTAFGGDDQDDLLRRFFGQQFEGRGQMPQRMPKQRGLGSGVIVSSDGYILTNNHVVDGADRLLVDLTDGRTLNGKVIGTDKPSDLALVKVDATNLPFLTLGNSDVVQVGDVVLAVGNPLGIGQTVTMGIISAKGRSTGNEDGAYEDFLQTDAPINHGNSGGALVNMKGELVGINSQIVSQSDGNIGIGFAIPANMASHVMADLKKDGRVRRAQLGITIQPMTSDLAESLGVKEVQGVLVSGVAPGSAAERAGVKQGDILRSFNGQPVQDFNTLRVRVSDSAPGSTATLGILRDGSEKTLTVKLDEAESSKSARADDSADHDDKASLGVGVQPLTPELAARVGLPRETRGVLVSEVNPDGRAADAGIQEGDVILQVNRTPVQTVEELRNAVRKTTDRPTLLLVKREKRDLFVTVRPS